jgi:hypothetical protein
MHDGDAHTLEIMPWRGRYPAYGKSKYPDSFRHVSSSTAFEAKMADTVAFVDLEQDTEPISSKRLVTSAALAFTGRSGSTLSLSDATDDAPDDAVAIIGALRTCAGCVAAAAMGKQSALMQNNTSITSLASGIARPKRPQHRVTALFLVVLAGSASILAATMQSSELATCGIESASNRAGGAARCL